MNHFLFWFTDTLAFWSIAFLFIPLSIFKKLIPFGFLGGFVYTLVIQLCAIHVFKIWTFKEDILMLWGIPVFFLLSWTAVTFTFGYLLLRFTKYQSLIVLGFATIAVLINYTAQTHQMITHRNWSLFQTFIYGIFSHIIILYLLKFLYRKKNIGAMQP